MLRCSVRSWIEIVLKNEAVHSWSLILAMSQNHELVTETASRTRQALQRHADADGRVGGFIVREPTEGIPINELRRVHLTGVLSDCA